MSRRRSARRVGRRIVERRIACASLLCVANGCTHAGATNGGIKTPTPAPANTIVVDARSGRVTQSTTHFRTRDDVVLVVQNINPFVHQYRISGTRTTYSESAVPEFAKALGIPVTVPAAPPAPVALVTATGGGGKGSVWSSLQPSAEIANRGLCAESVAPAARAEADAQAFGLAAHADAVRARGAALTNAVDGLRALMNVAGQAMRDSADALRDPELADSVLRRRVERLYAAAKPYAASVSARTKPVEDSVTSYSRAVADLGTRAIALTEKYPGCLAFPQVRTSAAGWAADTSSYRGSVARASDHAAAITTLVGALERVRSAPEAMTLSRPLGDYDDPTVVELIVQRSAVGTDTVWRTIASPHLSFGERRRFAISVGATANRLAVAEYQAVKRYHVAAAGEPGDTVETVVVETARSDRQVAPVVTLSTRLLTMPYTFLDGLHLTVGTAPRSAQSKLALDYLIGMAVSAADERMLLGVGIVSAEEQRLAAGYSVGDRVPASQTSIPTRKARVTRPAISLTFRVF